MAKKTKRKLLIPTVLILVMLTLSTYATRAPTVHAEETSARIQEKGLSILNKVVGLDMAKYVIDSKEWPQDSYLGVIPQENVRCILESAGSKLDMICTFANGNLRMIDVLESQGSPCLTESATMALEMTNEVFSNYRVLEMAKVFLSNYQSHSEN
jgi:hypothetical protein